MKQSYCWGGILLYAIMLFLLFIPSSAYAQNYQLKGYVLDTANEPLIGANVIVAGTTNGVISGLDGGFTLSVSPNDRIEVSYMGYIKQIIPLNGRKTIKVIMQDDSQLLEETVVIGYGTLKKSDMTGAISSVDVESLASRATTNPAEALQGKVAGVSILKSGGNAGASISVKIRGIKTMGSNEPLYIIDGFPGDITTVNTQDIEAMEILKDGAAAAIYGSVAANGVVIVTTKNGKKGDVKVDFNTFFQFTSAAKKFEMLNADEYLNVHNMMYENAEAKKIGYLTFTDSDGRLKNPTGFDTNWQDEMLRGGLSQNYNVNVRGGSDIAKYSVSYNHSDEKGILRGNKYVQDNARMKLNVQKYIFNFDASLSLKVTQSQQPQYSIKEMYAMAPLVPVYDEDQPSGYGLNEMKVDGVRLELPNNRNVMADDHFKHKKSNGYDLIGNIGLTVDFAPWLKFKTAYAYRGYYTNTKYHSEKFTADVQGQQLYPYNYDYNSYWFEQTFDNVLTFDKTFGKHSLNVMAGSSLTAARKDWSQINVEGKKTVYDVVNGKLDIKDEAAGFFDPTSPTIDAGNGGTFTGNGSFWNYNRASFFGRVNYSYGGKYMLQATVRADGSSKFGKNNRWGVFPSVALGWRISEEEFFSKDIMSNLKLRVSWGRLGNENALGYYYAPTMTNDNTQWMSYIHGGNPWPGMSNLYLVNDDLRWETTDTKNIGVDFGFFNNKLYGSLNYYYNTTEDLLIEKVMPPSAGIYNPTVNVGKMRNKGFELELNYADNINGFEYNVGFNLFTTKNEMLKADPN
ncbi:SusC/RagA family TonB-linked outer membrane protein, partial [Bacteroides salyersiae]|uniref:SusC/RagA family TonB-linked outer membrane protein n=1 Tax=Bacteroides salyersiae TaxID=291644 RepID=UPI001230FCD0